MYKVLKKLHILHFIRGLLSNKFKKIFFLNIIAKTFKNFFNYNFFIYNFFFSIPKSYVMQDIFENKISVFW